MSLARSEARGECVFIITAYGNSNRLHECRRFELSWVLKAVSVDVRSKPKRIRICKSVSDGVRGTVKDNVGVRGCASGNVFYSNIPAQFSSSFL